MPPCAEKVEVPSIRQFLIGRSILLTGATGFLAKTLVEKILYEQPDVKQVYLLVRPGKESEGGQARVRQQVIPSPAFERLRQRYGSQYTTFMESKLTAVEGELGLRELGISPEARAQLQQEVDVVVNCAATTVFDERYDRALRINTVGARDVASFAAGCRNLQVFLHVSTSFVNGMRRGLARERPFHMNETIAEELGWEEAPKLDIRKEITDGLAAEKRIRAELSLLGPDFSEADVENKVKELGMQRARQYGWQDTYVFTKALGEMLVGEAVEEAGIPAAIVRPAIVEGAMQEPVKGWIEGIRMCDPILIAYGKGQLPGFVADKKGWLDVIPVDYVVRAMLAAMAYHAGHPHHTKVYQVATSAENRLMLSRLAEGTSRHFAAQPFTGKGGAAIKLPPILMYDSVQDFRDAMHSKLMLEGMASGKDSAAAKRRADIFVQKAEEYTDHLAKIYAPYTFYACTFAADNTMALNNGLQPDERQDFGFDLTSINWDEYIQYHIHGLRRFPLKGRMS